MKIFWNYSGPCLLHEFGGGMGGGGGATKTNHSETKDNSATAGGDNYGGGEGNTILVNDPTVALEGLKTVQKFIEGGADIEKVFATQTAQTADSSNQRLAELAQTKVSDGANITQKTVIAVVAIAGVIFVLPSLLKKH
jgi:hypothetical protein